MRKAMIKGRKEINGVKDEKVAKKGEWLAGKEKALIKWRKKKQSDNQVNQSFYSLKEEMVVSKMS